MKQGCIPDRQMIGGGLGELPSTRGKLGNKQSERIVNMVNKHWVTCSTIYLHIYISLRYPLMCVYIYIYFYISTYELHYNMYNQHSQSQTLKYKYHL